jgi:hypothetical protein
LHLNLLIVFVLFYQLLELDRVRGLLVASVCECVLVVCDVLFLNHWGEHVRVCATGALVVVVCRVVVVAHTDGKRFLLGLVG